MWTGETLKDWRQKMALTQAEAAARLGMTTRGFLKAEHSAEPVNRRLVLACKFLWLEHVMGADVVAAMLGEAD